MPKLNCLSPKRSEGGRSEYAEYIDKALATEGGHLAIGRGGFTLFFADGAWLSGYDCERIKAECMASGLFVIDSREAAFEKVADLVIRGPMVAVGRAADPGPHHSLSYAPLSRVAQAYRSIGAEVVEIGHRPSGVETSAVRPDQPVVQKRCEPG